MLDQDLATALAIKANDCGRQIDMAVQRATGDAAAEAARVMAVEDATEKATEQRITALHDALEAAERQALAARPPWFAQPWFVAPVAAILAGGIVAAAITR